MKFKIDQRFADSTINQLKALGIQYSVCEHEDYVQVDIEVKANKKVKMFRNNAELVMENYKKQLLQTPALTLQQYMIKHNKQIIQPQSTISNKLNHILLIHKLQQLTQKIKTKRNLLCEEVKHNRQLTKMYEKQTIKQQNKLQLNIQNSELRMEFISNSEPNNYEQQLQRIRNVLRNGMWGCRQKIQAHINKIQQLQ